MSTPDGLRSVRIGDDERTGWSSDRRRDGSPLQARGPKIAVRGRTLRPVDRQRYSPGSLVIILGPDFGAVRAFAERRLIEDKGAVFSATMVRARIEGKVDAEQLEETTQKLLVATIAKRLGADDSAVVLLDDLDPAARAPFIEVAAAARRPRHLILLDAGTEDDERKAQLNELRNTINAGGMGEEGFATALRLSGKAVDDVKRIVFRPPPADD